MAFYKACNDAGNLLLGSIVIVEAAIAPFNCLSSLFIAFNASKIIISINNAFYRDEDQIGQLLILQQIKCFPVFGANGISELFGGVIRYHPHSQVFTGPVLLSWPIFNNLLPLR